MFDDDDNDESGRVSCRRRRRRVKGDEERDCAASLEMGRELHDMIFASVCYSGTPIQAKRGKDDGFGSDCVLLCLGLLRSPQSFRSEKASKTIVPRVERENPSLNAGFSK